MPIKRTRPAGLRPAPTLPNHRKSPDHLGRIAALSKNARTTWFSLLGVLLFVGVTLLGFAHIDFYGYDRQTALPLIGVSVPTIFFFWTAPLLVAANYVYFHLYLIRLWDALGDAPARIGGEPLGRAIPPWLVTDAALWLRHLARGDDCTDTRPLEGLTAVLNFALTWCLGLLIGGMAWWLSGVARDAMMTGLAALALSGMMLTAVTSFAGLWSRMVRDRMPGRPVGATFAALFTALCLAAPSYFRTVDPAPWMMETERMRVWDAASGQLVDAEIVTPIYADHETPLWDRLWTLAEINLEGENIVEKPGNWLPFGLVWAEFERGWCAREAPDDCAVLGAHADAINEEFWNRQDSTLAFLKRPQWHNPGQRKPDFRGANLRETFLADIDLDGAMLHGADLSEAELRGADLSGAIMDWAILEEAALQGIDLEDASLNGADMTDAQLWGAVMDNARLQAANLAGANLRAASLKDAVMQRANFQWADLRGANVSGAQMQLVDLREADARAATLVFADLQDANLTHSVLSNADLSTANLQNANLASTELQDALLYAANLTGARLGNAVLTRANLSSAKLAGVNLDRARLDGTVLNGVSMSGADLSFSWIEGISIAPFDILRPETGGGWPQADILQAEHSITGTRNQGGAVREVDFAAGPVIAGLDWRNAFVDGSVTGQDRLTAAMGLATPPCQWTNAVLDDATFYGRWRGWLALNPDPTSDLMYNWAGIAPAKWADVTAIPPPPGCAWATGPLTP
ncbi:pentapeptide repeat-containing protein [Yoonia sp. SS1-5]|uniref:Pentapeptide repeat-containing protein n=1 Tax=Yoonia rhodophyticola TaxID=3137370 RepID=A0AAN0NL06_9RHOB